MRTLHNQQVYLMRCLQVLSEIPLTNRAQTEQHRKNWRTGERRRMEGSSKKTQHHQSQFVNESLFLNIRPKSLELYSRLGLCEAGAHKQHVKAACEPGLVQERPPPCAGVTANSESKRPGAGQRGVISPTLCCPTCSFFF